MALVGGRAALLVDARAALWDRLPGVLYVAGGPIRVRAVLLDLLSLSAGMGGPA